MKKISFIVIAYNEGKNIRSCINSITAQAGVTAYEIVVVNDGSTDETKYIVNQIARSVKNMKIVNFKKNHGRGAARSEGVSRSTGDVLVFIDGDTILPAHWTMVCLQNLKHYDAVGGIAIPDGDVTYIYRKFGLTPKITHHTTELTGNNCMIKKNVLIKIKINKNLRDGEDVDFVWRAKIAGFKVTSIDNLVVRHIENKSFAKSLRWLFQSGIGASRLLFRHKKARMPDVLFFIYILLLCVFLRHYWYVLSMYPFVVGYFHIRSKFYFKCNDFLRIFGAIIVDYSFMHAYFLGRFVGLFLYV